jgi:Amt family ammonium transporter
VPPAKSSTPASGFVDPRAAMAIGAIAGVACYLGATVLKRALRADDSLDVFGVHGIGGIVGALLTGVFADSSISGVTGSLATQAIGVAATLAYSGVATAILLGVIDATLGLRVTKAQEREGLDIALHGERIE